MKAEFVPQVEIMGRRRNRIHRLQRGPSIEIVRYPRTSRVIMGTDEFGNFAYIPLPRLSLDASSLPHLHRGAEKLFDRAAERNAFTTAKRRRTTTAGTLTNRGTFRPEKVDGFSLSYERRRVKQIREEQKLKRGLLKNGINEHQLFLLMHSAYHSQTLLERPSAKKPSPKIGGFKSSHEVKIMREQRLRNQRLASRGNIYKY